MLAFLCHSASGKSPYYKPSILSRFLSQFWESSLAQWIYSHMMSSVGQYEIDYTLSFLDFCIDHFHWWKVDQMRSDPFWYLMSNDVSVDWIAFSNGVSLTYYSFTYCLVFIIGQSENYCVLLAPHLLELLHNLGFAFLVWQLNDLVCCASLMIIWLVVICNW